MPKFHFVSGLPRSDSILLSGILKQNPHFHAGISSSRAQVKFEPRRSVRPHDLSERFKTQSFWTEATTSQASAIISRPEAVRSAAQGSE